MKRTFVAIKIKVNSDFVSSLKKLQIELIKENIRWIDINKYHLTLCFVGNTDDKILDLLSNKLNNELRNYSEFCISSTNFDVFRSSGKHRVFYVGIENSNYLIKIKEIVQNIFMSYEYQFEVREFKPHVTIARAKQINDRNNLVKICEKYKDEFKFNLSIKNIYFYESVLSYQGFIYKGISKIVLVDNENT